MQTLLHYLFSADFWPITVSYGLTVLGVILCAVWIKSQWSQAQKVSVKDGQDAP